MKRFFVFAILAVAALTLSANASEPFLSFNLYDEVKVSAPSEGLWSVATGWENDWMCDWHHASPTKIEKQGEWEIAHGKIALEQGDILLRDSYRRVENGLIHCIRRYEWHGSKPRCVCKSRARALCLVCRVFYTMEIRMVQRLMPRECLSITLLRASLPYSRSIAILCRLQC